MLSPQSRAVRALVCLFVLVSVGPARTSKAQEISFPSTLGDAQAESPLEQYRQRLQRGASSTTTVPMEGAVDPGEYVVGPGDVFSVSIGGPQPTAILVPVAADGRLVLPEGGAVAAAGKVLQDVRESALRILARSFSNVSLDVSLAQPRQFYVHVVGAVPAPGRYLALPVARVSDLLQFAFADTTNAPVSNLDYRPSLRNVQLIRRDSTSVSVDLARYFSTGDTRLNPYVRDGDVINVSAYRVDDRGIFVNGAVPFPGIYDFRPSDTVSDILAVAGIGEDLSSIGTVRLARRAGEDSVRTWLFRAEDLRGSGGAMGVRPLDNISVEPVNVLAGTAEVEGYVRYPGKYAIVPGRTTLKELVELAGGLREGALVRSAYIARDVLPTPTPSRDQQNRVERQMLAVEVLRPDTVEIMRYLRQSDLDFMSRTQFAQGLRIQNRVSVDLAAALEAGAPPIYLQDGDRLVVPQDKRAVFVFGHVERPGYVPFEPGLTATEYIARAGGRNDLGADAYVVQAGTGRYLDARSAAIGSGDLVFVDSRVDVADNAELQRLVLEENRAASQERMQLIQAISQTVFALASLISVYVTLRNR